MPMRPEKAALYREATRAAELGLVVNGALGIAKLVGGIVAHSYALISDAVHSLTDLLMSVGVLSALWFAQRPPDKEHPYGHTRAEAIAGSNLALLILVSAAVLAWQVFGGLSEPRIVPPAWTLLIAAANVLVKEGLYRYKIRVGRRLNSALLIANAWDHRGDALSSLAVLIGLSIVRLGGPGWGLADPLAALVVILIITASGAHLFRDSISELMDRQAGEDLVASVREAARAVPGVEDIETLWVRKSGLEYLVDIHVEIDGRLPIAEGHRIGHLVEDGILKQFPAVRDVLVHIEPFPRQYSKRKAGSAVAVPGGPD
jgi:cation diffusion facilitator family transporter